MKQFWGTSQNNPCSKMTKTNALLWEFTKNGEDYSYLFGTMHVFDANLYVWERVLHEKIMECTAFYTEVDFNESSNESHLEGMELADGLTLRDILKPKQYQFLRKVFLKNTGIGLDHLENMQPIILTNLLQSSFVSKDLPFSLDQSLWAFAEKMGKEVGGLEQYASQVEIMQSFELSYQVKQLKDLLNNFKQARKKMKALVQCYLRQDIRNLYQKSVRSLKQYKKTLVYDRNRDMLREIDSVSAQTTAFYAIGAAHLYGKKGLLAGLKKKGWKISPVSLSAD